MQNRSIFTWFCASILAPLYFLLKCYLFIHSDFESNMSKKKQNHKMMLPPPCLIHECVFLQILIKHDFFVICVKCHLAPQPLHLRVVCVCDLF